jgi:hypothetical protein
MNATSIASINMLPWDEKIPVYSRFIPDELMEAYGIRSDFLDDDGVSLLTISCEEGSSDVEVDLRHQAGSKDPLLYAHLTDTVNGQIHVLLYVVNDPDAQRFDVDRMPDGSPTRFGVLARNIEAEKAAMQAGLAPGQVRRGLRLLKHSTPAFESFVQSLGHDLFFVEPLFYHNAVIFERYGLAYVKGHMLMKQIHAGFQEGGELHAQLDRSTPFRMPEQSLSIRGRSWALHDGVMGRPFCDVTMYKRVGIRAEIETFPGAMW